MAHLAEEEEGQCATEKVKRMQEEVEKFFDDSDSNVELTMLHSQTNNSRKYMKEEKIFVKGLKVNTKHEKNL